MADDKLIINIETQVDNSQLDKGIQEINKKVDNVDKTIDIQTKIDAVDAANSIGDLKKALKDLQSAALQVGDSNKESLDKINIAAGKAKDQIGDLKDGFNSLSGSPIENVATSFDMLKQKMFALDIDGVKQQFGNLKLSLIGVAQQLGLVEVGANGVAVSMRGILVASGIGALIAAVALLAANWEEVKAAIDNTSVSQRRLDEDIRESNASIQKEVTNLQVLLVIQNDDNISREKKIELFKEQQKLHPKLLENLSAEDFLQGKVNGKIRDTIVLLQSKALAEAYQRKLSEASIKLEESAILDAEGRIVKYRFNMWGPMAKQAQESYKMVQEYSTKLAQLIAKTDTTGTSVDKALNETATGKLDPIGNFFSNGEKKAEDSGKKSAEEFKKGFDEYSKANFELDIITPASIEEFKKKMGDFLSQFKMDVEKYGSDNPIPLNLEPKIVESSDGEDPIISLQDRFTTWVENNREKINEVASWLSGISDTVGQLGDAIQGIFQIRINRAENAADKEIAALQRTFDAATKGKNLSNAQMVALENKLAQDKYKIALDTFNKEEKLREKAFKANQAIQIVQAVIGTAQGIIASFSEPFLPLVIARMAMVAATGAIQIGVIASQKYQPGQAPTAPSPAAIPEPSLGSGSSSSNGPDKSFQAAQFFGLGGKIVSDMNGPQYQKVIVTEGDISGVQRKVNVIEEGARFL